MKIDDRLIGPGLILLGVGVAVAAWQLPSVPGVRFGADLMPLICAGGLFLFGAAITRSGLREHGPLLSFDDWRVHPRNAIATLWVLAGLVAGIFLFEPLGFPLFGILFMGGLMWLMGSRPVTILLVAPIFVMAMHLTFTKVMFVDLPTGPLAGVL